MLERRLTHKQNVSWRETSSEHAQAIDAVYGTQPPFIEIFPRKCISCLQRWEHGASLFVTQV